MKINVHEAKTQLSRLIAKAEAGEEVIIARHGKPMAKLVPVEEALPKRRAGSMKGKIWLDDHFSIRCPRKSCAPGRAATVEAAAGYPCIDLVAAG